MDKRDKDMVKGQRVDDVKKYISRLSTAKRRAEKRILQLGGKLYNQREEKSSIDVNGSSAANEVANGTRRIRVASPTDSMLGEGVGVSALLCEPGLTYFREFMEGEKLVMVLGMPLWCTSCSSCNFPLTLCELFTTFLVRILADDRHDLTTIPRPTYP